MFSRSLEDNVEGSAEDGFVTCEVLEGSLKTLSGPFVVFSYDAVVLVSWG